MRVAILFVFFVMQMPQLHAQEFQPDTIKPVAATVKFYASLDSLNGDTIYTINSPKGYVIASYKMFGTMVYIALATRKGYDVFDADPCEFTMDQISSVGDFDLNGKGNPELELGWSSSTGRSGWIDGWNESSGGIIIWDLDKREMLFCMQDRYEYNYWYNGVEFDSLGEILRDTSGNVIADDSASGSEHSCENYDVNLEFRKITVQRSADCPVVNENTGEESPVDTRWYIYEWHPCGLVLKK